ncbi:unnamed protein product [Ceutorhynchus assimilis]|uniref:PHD and RING finger domain-containing protein 1 n=1 Tax=Ceutorhynchus assimilis TaxID=467358 RepID=A0A9P0GSJ7_9CUCU|nr:unnamed protein product [Ceutorhynchus assimilis]
MSSSSSGDENEGPHKRKRKVRRLPDSPSNTSSGSPIIGASTSRTRRNLPARQFTKSDSDSSDSDVFVRRKKIPKVDFSSDSSSSTFYRRKPNGPFRFFSSDESEDSDRPIGVKKPDRLVITSDLEDSQWETESNSDDEIQGSCKANASVLAEGAAIDSDCSDGQSEKCPICLVRFKLQKVGVPENCGHKFCLECILEWSKTVNTCPVDRKEYNAITARSGLNEKVLKTIPVDTPVAQHFDEIIDGFDEQIICIICGSGQNEDRLLLCDGCDLGYHLYCLTPPLSEVPNDPWFCEICRSADEPSLVDLLEDGEDEVPRLYRIATVRLIPRTRQSERVRRLVQNNRNQRQHQTVNENSPSTSRGRVNSSRVSSTSTRKPKKKSRKRKTVTRYTTVWELDRNGEAVPVQKKVKSRKRKSKKKQRRPSTAQKSVKNRLASQLGMCAPRNTSQILPDVRPSGNSSNNIGHRRHQAGIPALDLVGSVNRLDYFSQSEDEVLPSEGIHTLLARRAPNPLDIMNLRRVARRKAAVVGDIPTVSSSTDILDSIMDSQERFLSKNSILSVVDSSGKLQIDSKKKEPSINNNTPSKPDFNSYSVRETPWNNGRNSGSYRPYNNRNNWSNNRNNWQNNSYQGRYGQSNNYNNYNNDGNNYTNNYGPNNVQGQDQLYNDTPQDYTQRTLSETETAQEEEEEEEEEEEQVAESSNAAAAAADDGDVDIYGDIEMVSTSKVEDDFPFTSPTVAEIPNLVTNTNTDDDNDSESGMVIDTDPVSSTVQVYSPAQPTDSPDEQSVDDPQSVALEFDQLTRELSSGFNALQEMEKEFATGLKQFEPLMSSSEPTSEIPITDPEITDDIPVPDEVSAETIPMPIDQPQQSSFTFRSNRGSTEKVHDDDDTSNDECPNFSIYSKESKSVALHTDTNLITESSEKPEEIDPITDESAPSSPQPQKVTVEKTGSDPRLMLRSSSWNLGALYSDSEDESVVKKTSSFAVNDIKDMTEDILSEEDQERSYTPVLDERSDKKEGLEGLDTEMISDDDRNDFDEAHELKTVSDGDALEINAKESELEFTRPEDFEEGEIMNKNKEKEKIVDAGGESPSKTPEIKSKKDKEKSDSKKGDKDTKKKKKGKNKEGSEADSANKENMNKESFKKLTKNTKERNYRDKDKKKDSRERSRSKTPEITESEKDNKKKREKRKELERYNVRALIADKPRQPPKDQFGRDLRRTPSRSRSRSYTPPLPQTSPSRRRRTPSPVRAPSPATKRKSRSRTKTPPRRRSTSKRRSKSRSKTNKRKGRSTSRSGGRKRDRSKTKKRKRSVSRNKRKKSKDKSKKRQRRSTSRRRSRSPRGRSVTPRRDRREWTPSLSRSVTPDVRHNMSPSWTPPPEEDADTLRNQNVTVILNNDATRKRKEKRNRDRRRRKDEPPTLKRRRRERERTPPPSKEVFASGDNILVSVSFNNENETRDVSTRDNRKRKEGEQKKTRERRSKNRKDLSGVKPVAIIDLERSPFQEIASSPKDVIILSDSDNTQPEARNIQSNTCDSSQQVASPEATPDYAMGGPKTPPEPSVKFALLSKPPQLRAINNPLHDPLETIEEVADELNSSHKGPNTPLEDPPNSAPSSPDAYDPFEPTKSRSATPEVEVVCQGEVGDNQNQEVSNRVSLDLDKSGGQTPDIIKSSTPPMPDIQPADSQSSVQEITESESPVGLPAIQTQVSISKPVGQTIPFSSIQTTLATSTPVSSIIPTSRINILSSIITPSIIPTRIVQPNQVKSSPVKILPTKAAIKSTPIKPIQSKPLISSKKPNKQPNGNSSLDDINLEFDSPYSPGSSDYEDLFEPPIEPAKPKTLSKTKRSAVKKNQSTFDVLFGSPTNKKGMTANKRSPVKKGAKKGSKLVGVKIDEDSLKILEDMPNSAVEMQVKDKFLKKLNRQERVVEEVKLVLKPYYNKKKITKDEYKDIMRRAVPKICHNKNGEINPLKIRSLTEAYVKKLKHNKKVTSSSSLPQKVI